VIFRFPPRAFPASSGNFYIFGMKESKIAVLDHRENPFFFINYANDSSSSFFSEISSLGSFKAAKYWLGGI
jgi:hypothetical protein